MASTNLFSVAISDFVKDTKKDLESGIKEAEIELFSRVILRTPVGNPDFWASPPPKNYVGGRLRGNWGVNQSIDNIDASGSETLQNMQLGVNAEELGGVLTFVNNLPYAEVIEYGRSKQAPEGMVRVSVLEFDGILKAVFS